MSDSYEQLYKGLDGDWHVSVWKDGKKFYTASDGHTYFEDAEGGGGHVDCWECLSQEDKKMI